MESRQLTIGRDWIHHRLLRSIAKLFDLRQKPGARGLRVCDGMTRAHGRLMQQLVHVVQLHRWITPQMGGQELAYEFHESAPR
jgi:hypothetical protein